ncbi:hypothetical protein L1887_29872 [Cichorium endivia]|nr:hypothetical protein L1887_29872 [Cichorium endivia]
MEGKLTEGAIWKISSGEWQPTDPKPVLQVIECVTIPGRSFYGGGRVENDYLYLILLSDGLLQQQGIIITERDELVRCLPLRKGCIVQLKHFCRTTVDDKRILIVIHDLDVIHETWDVIGDAYPFPPMVGSENPISMPTQPISHATTTTTIP